MAFNSIPYGLFLAAVFFGYWLLSGRDRRWARLWFLLAASYFFYGAWNPAYLSLIIAVTLINFAAALRIDYCRKKDRLRSARWWLIFATIAGLGLLGVFKYYDFFMDNVSRALEAAGFTAAISASRLLLPLGISFYTFQGLSYAIDVYRGRIPATRSLRDFALYIAFFPQVSAGPIIRAEVLLPQFQEDLVYSESETMRGLFQIMSGLFKKIVIADLLAHYIVNKAFDNPSGASAPLLWMGMYGYTLQIYCDFSGYSDVAIGTARMLGIKIPANFDRPYLATSPREFWRRWHISLSTWLRDYLYISLGGSKLGKQRMYFALFITMLLGGLWHGAAWTFVIWGAYHGLLLMVNRALQEKRAKGAAEPVPGSRSVWLGRIVTFHLVCIGWVIFRAPNFSEALLYFKGMITAPMAFADVRKSMLLLLGFGYALHLSPPWVKQTMENAFFRTPLIIKAAALAVLLAFFSLLKTAGVPFIYFKF